MALVLKDRVRETSIVTGTGTATLNGAVYGYQSFSVIGDGNTTYYTISGVGSTEWEVGIGTYTASGTTLSRDTVLESSNSGALVNFSGGTKDVFVTYPAERAVYVDGTTLTPASTAVLPITSGGTGSNSATFSGANITNLNASNVSTGTLAVARGGTGAATLTANNVILGNGTSAVLFVAPGSSGNVLTSNGTTWTSAAAAAFDAGTRLIFAQNTAPTGWTKDTTNYNNHALRVVTGTASTGGTVDFTTAFTSQSVSGTVSVTASTGQTAQGGTVSIGQTTAGGSVSSSVPAASTGAVTQGGTVGDTTLSTPTIPSHSHNNPGFGAIVPGNPAIWVPGGNPNRTPQYTYAISSTGGGGAHDHSFSGQSHSHPVSVTVSSSFTGTAHNHTSPFTGDLHNHPVSAPASFTGSAINLAVKYLDVITATKN